MPKKRYTKKPHSMGTSEAPPQRCHPDAPTPQVSYFLRLPPEIRIMVYDLVMWAPMIEYLEENYGAFASVIPMIIVVSIHHNTSLTNLTLCVIRSGCVTPEPTPDLALLRVKKLIGGEASHRSYSATPFYICMYHLMDGGCWGYKPNPHSRQSPVSDW